MKRTDCKPWLAAVWLSAAGPAFAQAAANVYYQCPGNVFTNTITAKDAEAKGCKALAVSQPTTIAAPKPRPVAANPVATNGSAPRGSDTKVDANEQRARDSDARKILETELKREEVKLAEMQKEFNNGEPERRGDERNYQRYLDRVEEMKAAIARKQSDVAALKRELAKLPAPKE